MSETIKLVNLTRHFTRGETKVHALRGVDLTVKAGEFVALVGPSGSGKSTLLNLLGGLDRPSSGELWLDGLSLHDTDAPTRTRHRRERVGFIFQGFNLLPRLTALENVAIPLMLAGVAKATREERATTLLEQVGLGHRLHHYPTELSGGEQQRTAVARALIHSPALILADEPTGNLDSQTGQEVMALLKKLNREQGITLILVTHDLEVAAYASRIVRLRDGQIEAIEERETTIPAASHIMPVENWRRQGGLTWRDIVGTAMRNLRRRPVRNILTAGGVLIGIVTLVAMVSFGVGVQEEVRRNFETVGLENIFVEPAFAEQDEFDPFARRTPEKPLTPALVAQIHDLPGVLEVTPNLGLPGSVNIALYVDEVAYPIRLSDGFSEGRFGLADTTDILAGEGLAEGETRGAVLVPGLAEQLLNEGEALSDLIGKPILLQAQLPRGEVEQFSTTIIGIRDGFGTRTVDLGVPERAEIKAWWFGEEGILESEGYDMLIVKADKLSRVPRLIDALEDLGVETQSLEAILEVANQVLSLLQALLGSVGGLALLVAALGVANTMMMAIYERTREIGVLKALGASAREIRSLFMVEASFIGLIGGTFGLLFGTLLGRLVDWIGHRYLISEGVTGVGQLSVVPPWLAIGSLLFAAFIGVAAGLYPAARAARLDPVTALRHE